MAYADDLRSTEWTGEEVATLIEGVVGSGSPLAWSDWSPSYSASGSMTYTGVTTTYAKYFQIGEIVFFMVSADGTTGGTASNNIIVSLPVTAASYTGAIGFGYGDLVSGVDSVIGYKTNTTELRITPNDNGNLALGAGKTFYLFGFYRTA